MTDSLDAQVAEAGVRWRYDLTTPEALRAIRGLARRGHSARAIGLQFGYTTAPGFMTALTRRGNEVALAAYSAGLLAFERSALRQLREHERGSDDPDPRIRALALRATMARLEHQARDAQAEAAVPVEPPERMPAGFSFRDALRPPQLPAPRSCDA